MRGSITHKLNQEFRTINKRWLFAQFILAPFPYFVGSRIRAEVLRILGFNIGKDVCFWGLPTLIGGGKLHQKLGIGQECLFNVQCFFDLATTITIGNNVVLGPQVMLITGAHTIGTPENRLGPLVPRPIKIDNGAWLGARSTVLPGVTIGHGAVVAAGSLVTKDVAPNILVGGVPAKKMRSLEFEEVFSAS